MRTVKLLGTNVLRRNIAAQTRIIVNQGGTRSSKTYSIIQKQIIALSQTTNEILTIARKTGPALKSTVMRDFFDVLKSLELYDERFFNATDRTYELHGNLVEFISMDDPQKKRGGKRNRLWLNEANEFTHEDFIQLLLRTSGPVDLDYNPSDEYHWIYDKVLTRNDCTFIQSTYKDNLRFLPVEMVAEIERLKDEDPNYWKIYGLGERGTAKATIFDRWGLIDTFPENVDEELYAVDFGFNNPSVLLRIGVKDKRNCYLQELLYESKLTNTDLIARFESLIPDKSKLIKADSAEPDRIEELRRAGFYVQEARKGKNSVKDGIDVLKRFKTYITKDSTNVIKEIRHYKWKEDKDGHVLDEPVKFNDHAMDAWRYGVGDGEPGEANVWVL